MSSLCRCFLNFVKEVHPTCLLDLNVLHFTEKCWTPQDTFNADRKEDHNWTEGIMTSLKLLIDYTRPEFLHYIFNQHGIGYFWVTDMMMTNLVALHTLVKLYQWPPDCFYFKTNCPNRHCQMTSVEAIYQTSHSPFGATKDIVQ